MPFTMITSLLLTVLLATTTPDVSATPTFDLLDRLLRYPFDEYLYVRQPVRRSTYDLQSGYYYIDNVGSITPVTATANRRQDVNSPPDGVRYQPLVRVKQTKTKRKKLFVPNLFG